MKIRSRSLLAVALGLVLPLANANAALLTFSDAELVSMTASSTDNAAASPDTQFLGAKERDVAPGGFYTDGDPMTYRVGFRGDLARVFPGAGVAKQFFHLADVGDKADAATTLAAAFYNDNNQIWGVGLWVDDGSGKVESGITYLNGAIAGPPRSTNVELDISGGGIGDIQEYGFFVVWDPSQNGGSNGDRYHMSVQAVPEPGSLLLWAGMGLGCVLLRRKKLI